MPYLITIVNNTVPTQLLLESAPAKRSLIKMSPSPKVTDWIGFVNLYYAVIK